jgi:hypothetical protein
LKADSKVCVKGKIKNILKKLNEQLRQKHTQLITSAKAEELKRLPYQKVDSIKRLEHDELESNIQENDIAYICGTVGNGKTHLLKDVLRNFSSPKQVELGRIASTLTNLTSIFLPFFQTPSTPRRSILYVDLNCLSHIPKDELALETFTKAVIRKLFGDGILSCQMSPSELLQELLKTQNLSEAVLVLDPIDFVLESHQELLASFINLLNSLKKLCYRVVLSSRLSFVKIQNPLHISTFTPDQSRDFLIQYFGSRSEDRLAKVEQQLDLFDISEFCAHNPLALSVVAGDIDYHLMKRSTIESDYLVRKKLEEFDVDERGETFEQIFKSALKALSKHEKIVLEALTLFPDDIKFHSLTTLLNIEKVREEFPGHDNFYPKLEEITNLCNVEHGIFLDFCDKILDKLMQLSVLKLVSDGCYRVEPIIKKLAFSIFSKNPFEDLRVNYVRLQLQFLLRDYTQETGPTPPSNFPLPLNTHKLSSSHPSSLPSPSIPSFSRLHFSPAPSTIIKATLKGFSLEESDETQIAQALYMLLQKFSKTGPYKLLNLSYAETKTLLLQLSPYHDVLLQLLDSQCFFDHPTDYMALWSKLSDLQIHQHEQGGFVDQIGSGLLSERVIPKHHYHIQCFVASYKYPGGH